VDKTRMDIKTYR